MSVLCFEILPEEEADRSRLQYYSMKLTTLFHGPVVGTLQLSLIIGRMAFYFVDIPKTYTNNHVTDAMVPAMLKFFSLKTLLLERTCLVTDPQGYYAWIKGLRESIEATESVICKSLTLLGVIHPRNQLLFCRLANLTAGVRQFSLKRL